MSFTSIRSRFIRLYVSIISSRLSFLLLSFIFIPPPGARQERIYANTENEMKISKVADQLIGSLKSDLASQTALTREIRPLQKLVATRTKEMEKLQAQVGQLNTSLTAAMAENRALSTKLSHTRTAALVSSSSTSLLSSSSLTAAAAATAAASSSSLSSHPIPNGTGAIKGGRAGHGLGAPGPAEAAKVAQMAQLKENLYSDLTGLIIPNIKRTDEADVYDCIQTGRNGSTYREFPSFPRSRVLSPRHTDVIIIITIISITFQTYPLRFE